MKNSYFDNIVHFIVSKCGIIEKTFVLALFISILCYPFVGINYDLSTYLPEFAPTKQALDVMEDEFGYPGLARVMLKNVSVQEAKRIREEIADVDGVSIVLGPDSVTQTYMSESFVQSSLDDFNNIIGKGNTFYKDGNAVMEIVFEEGSYDQKTREAVDKIYKIAGDNASYAGSAVANKERQESVVKELTVAVILALFVTFALLALTTESWFEPVLFILIMGIAIILNMGTNIIFGEISFFTFSISAILQLAVSIDYSIFLLHTFKSYRNSGMEMKPAMESALKEACLSILSSGATTIVGFIVMALMRFNIGSDMGFVLAKGVICSLLTVIFLMPSLIIRFTPLIEKFSHKSFVPSFGKFSMFLYKIHVPVLIVCIIIAAPSYVGQTMNRFKFGDEAQGAGPGTKVYDDARDIEKEFGKSNIILAIVPNGSVVKERNLTDDLDDLGFVNYAVSLSGTLPKGIPQDFLPDKLTKEFRTDDFSRIIISMKNSEESDYSFTCSNTVNETVKRYYPEGSYVIGLTPTAMDIRDILTVDYNRVSLFSLLGVALVVMITFKTIFIPILIVIPIELAIFINMTMPYIAGENVIYIGYIIVGCVQIGATVDYSILMTNNYLLLRDSCSNRKEAALKAIQKSALSILTSGSILMVVGYIIYFTSSIRSISQVGHFVGRGAFLSVLLVLTLLPALLSLFDRTIMHRLKHVEEKKKKKLLKKKKISVPPDTNAPAAQ
ncbi:MMPL family transporter [Lachnospiraceae bacterium NSJ-143]|nr:MMPL family transporter [Lachnospiraceae bacterium NSJ-143]